MDSDDELSCYGDDLNIIPGIDVDEGASSKVAEDVVTLQVDRKSSTGSQVIIIACQKCFDMILYSNNVHIKITHFLTI